jgi:hypothetical protein
MIMGKKGEFLDLDHFHSWIISLNALLSHPVPGGRTERIPYVCQDPFPHIC